MGSRTSKAGLAPCWTPSPSHAGHQPSGLLNEKWCGLSGSNDLPQFSHVTRYWDQEHGTYAARLLPGEYYVTTHGENVCTVRM